MRGDKNFGVARVEEYSTESWEWIQLWKIEPEYKYPDPLVQKHIPQGVEDTADRIDKDSRRVRGSPVFEMLEDWIKMHESYLPTANEIKGIKTEIRKQRAQRSENNTIRQCVIQL